MSPKFKEKKKYLDQKYASKNLTLQYW